VEFDGRVYFRLLAAVAASDGVIKDEEIKKFGELLVIGGGDASLAEGLCEEALSTREDPLHFMRSYKPSSRMGRICLRDALFVAYSDGEYDERERAVITDAAQQMGVESDLAAVTEWVEGTVALASRHTMLFLTD